MNECAAIGARGYCHEQALPGISFCSRHRILERFDSLQIARFRMVYDESGPCSFKSRLLKTNRKSIVVAHRLLSGRIAISRPQPPYWYHFEPCQSCPDHPDTIYPEAQANVLDALPEEYRHVEERLQIAARAG